jgi:hypothetical protein
MERLPATLAKSAGPAPANMIVASARPAAVLFRLLNFFDERKYPIPHTAIKRNSDRAVGIFDDPFCDGRLKLVFDQQAINSELRELGLVRPAERRLAALQFHWNDSRSCFHDAIRPPRYGVADRDDVFLAEVPRSPRTVSIETNSPGRLALINARRAWRLLRAARSASITTISAARARRKAIVLQAAKRKHQRTMRVALRFSLALGFPWR